MRLIALTNIKIHCGLSLARQVLTKSVETVFMCMLNSIALNIPVNLALDCENTRAAREVCIFLNTVHTISSHSHIAEFVATRGS